LSQSLHSSASVKSNSKMMRARASLISA
jgi:hypothetical protein